MVDSPCSRIGHIYKHNPFPDPRGGKDYLTKNFKRVAEVWMVSCLRREESSQKSED